MTANVRSRDPIDIRRATQPDHKEWLRLRRLLWPASTAREHRSEMPQYLDGKSKVVFVATGPSKQLVGFLEATIRPFAEGCETEPVGYIEGWYVDADLRRRGIGKRLVQAAEAWARQAGCVEMGSDCLLDNRESRSAHLAIGYEERERLIHFRKWLRPERNRGRD